MLDFDVPLKTISTVTQTAVIPQVTETVRVIPNQAQGFVGKDVANWNWSDLRDYIVTQIEKRHGPQVRDPKKESGICKGFISRWGIERSVAIAKAAFEVHDGMWRNAPISMTRFTKNSDPYFSTIIAKNLT